MPNMVFSARTYLVDLDNRVDVVREEEQSTGRGFVTLDGGRNCRHKFPVVQDFFLRHCLVNEDVIVECVDIVLEITSFVLLSGIANLLVPQLRQRLRERVREGGKG